VSAKGQSGGIQRMLLIGAALLVCPQAGFAQQPAIDPGDAAPQAAVTLSTPEPATPDAPSALKFGEGSSPAVAVHRITAGDKFNIFLKSSLSGETFTEAGINTRLMDDWKNGRFGTTPGYWTRYRTELATSESRALLSKYVLPVMFHQDPRYHRMEQGGVFHRGFYAASRVLFTRADDGSSTINTSHLLGTLGSRTMANAYISYHDRTLGHTLESTGTVLLSDMGRNLLREFGPDLKTKFFSTRFGGMFARFTHKVRTVGVQETLQ
jgi:hypothetical protein